MSKIIKRDGKAPGRTDGKELTERTAQLLVEVRQLIENAQARSAHALRAELLLLNSSIGQLIRREILGGTKAEYGEQVISTLARQLTADYGAGFSQQNIFHMMRFVEVWPDQAHVHALSEHLGWSHFKELLYLENGVAREFYAEMCRTERWTVCTLRERVRSMLFERTAISKLPEVSIRKTLAQLRETDKMTPQLVFRDPYILDFLGLKDTFSEADLETAILRELERVLLELGTDFAFIARQKRMTIGNQDFYLDLLFYHRRLARLVAVDLKLGRFEAAYKGQMELYLRWLDRYERRQEHEESPIGLILCSTKDEEQIELLQLNQGEIRVAEYLTALPEKRLLAAKLHEAAVRAREQLSAREPHPNRAPQEHDCDYGRGRAAPPLSPLGPGFRFAGTPAGSSGSGPFSSCSIRSRLSGSSKRSSLACAVLAKRSSSSQSDSEELSCFNASAGIDFSICSTSAIRNP